MATTMTKEFDDCSGLFGALRARQARRCALRARMISVQRQGAHRAAPRGACLWALLGPHECER